MRVFSTLSFLGNLFCPEQNRLELIVHTNTLPLYSRLQNRKIRKILCGTEWISSGRGSSIQGLSQCWPYTRWLFIPFQLFRKVMGVQSPQSDYSIKDIIKTSGTKYNSKKPQGLVGRLSLDMRGCLTFIFFNFFLASWKSSGVWQAVETVAGLVSLDQIRRSEQNTLVRTSTNQWSHF